MSGALGMLGAKWILKGWYEGNNLMTSSTSGSVGMDRAHTLTAEWAADYAQSLILPRIVAAAVIGLAYCGRSGSR
jgi:hypothetical protein